MVLHIQYFTGKDAFHEIITLSHSSVNNYYIYLLVGKCISAFQTRFQICFVCVLFGAVNKSVCDLYALNSAINVLKSVCLYLRLFKSKPHNTVTLSVAAAPNQQRLTNLTRTLFRLA